DGGGGDDGRAGRAGGARARDGAGWAKEGRQPGYPRAVAGDASAREPYRYTAQRIHGRATRLGRQGQGQPLRTTPAGSDQAQRTARPSGSAGRGILRVGAVLVGERQARSRAASLARGASSPAGQLDVQAASLVLGGSVPGTKRAV